MHLSPKRKAWAEKLRRWEKGQTEEFAKVFLGPPQKITLLKAIPKVGVVVIMGDIRKGKSGLGYEIMDMVHQRRGMGGAVFLPMIAEDKTMQRRVKKLLPSWAEVVTERDKLPKHACILVDEAAEVAHVRRTQSEDSVDLDNFVGIAGQREQVIIFISHHARKLDPNLIHASTLLLWKQPTHAHVMFERDEMQRFTRRAVEVFSELTPKQALKTTYMMDLHKLRFCTFTNGLPDWWTQELSCIFQDIQGVKNGKSEDAKKKKEGNGSGKRSSRNSKGK